MASKHDTPASDRDPAWIDQLALNPARRKEALMHYRRAEQFVDLLEWLVRGARSLASAATRAFRRRAAAMPGRDAMAAPTVQER